MSKVALNVAIEVKSEHRERVLAALLAHRERCLAGEPGTLQFEVLVASDDPSRLFLFELYRDASALSAHASGASIAAYREDVKDKIQNSSVTKCLLGHELSA